MGIKRRTEEEIAEILREAEKNELSVADICRSYGIADVTFYKWRKRYGGAFVGGFTGGLASEAASEAISEIWPD